MCVLCLRLDDELSHGMTTGCQTFESPPLTTEEKIIVLPARGASDGTRDSQTIRQASFSCIAVELYVLL
jgi:hypothetical protein